MNQVQSIFISQVFIKTFLNRMLIVMGFDTSFALGAIASIVLTILLVVILPIATVCVLALSFVKKNKRLRKIGLCMVAFYLLLVAYNRYDHYHYKLQRTAERKEFLAVIPEVWVPKGQRIDLRASGAYGNVGIEEAFNNGYIYSVSGTIKLYGFHVSQSSSLFNPKQNECDFSLLIRQRIEDITAKERTNTCVVIKHLPNGAVIYTDSDSASMMYQYARFATVKDDTLVIIEMNHQEVKPDLSNPANKTRVAAIGILTNLQHVAK